MKVHVLRGYKITKELCPLNLEQEPTCKKKRERDDDIVRFYYYHEMSSNMMT